MFSIVISQTVETGDANTFLKTPDYLKKAERRGGKKNGFQI